MKEYIGSARNIMFSEAEDETFKVGAEFVLLLSEPVFEVDVGGGVIRRRSCESLRFYITVDSGERLVERLNEAIDAMHYAKRQNDSQEPSKDRRRTEERTSDEASP